MNLGQQLKNNNKGKGPVYVQWESVRHAALENAYANFKHTLRDDIQVKGFSAPLSYDCDVVFHFRSEHYQLPSQESVKHLKHYNLTRKEERDWARRLKSHGLAFEKEWCGSDYLVTPWNLWDTITWYIPRPIRTTCKALFG